MIGAVPSYPRVRRPLAAVVILTGAALLAAGCAARNRPVATPAVHAPSASASAAPSAPACPASGVLITPGSGDAAMGLRVVGIDLVNCGTRPYRLDGYPSVRALDKTRAPLKVRTLRGLYPITGPLGAWSKPPKPVVLSPGEHAQAVIAWRNTYDNITHPPVVGPYASIAPSSGEAVQVITVPEGGLDLGSTGRLAVSPWRHAEDVVSSPSPVVPTPSTSPLL